MSNSDPEKRLDALHPTASNTVTAPRDGLQPITLGTLGMFLLGSRDAILSLAASRGTLWLGMTFVFSAAFAREYDGEDLLYEPWHLLLPLVASLVTSFILFGLTSLIGWCRHAGLHGFWSRYRTFVGLYWMTAPLAWMYAIPVERFLSAGDATTANLGFLACVSLWRVILITRILSILFNANVWQVLFIVMLFADSVALALVSRLDVQVLAVMGGVRLTAAEAALSGVKVLVMFFGSLSLPIWFVVSATLASRRWSPWKWQINPASRSRSIPSSVCWFAAASVAVWCLPLPWTQTEQQLRGAAEREFRAGQYNEMLAGMSAHQQDDYPPHWDPPPRIGAKRERRRIVNVVSAFTPDTVPWVRAVFCEKLSVALGRADYPMGTLWEETNVEELARLIDDLPESIEIVKGKTDLLSHLLEVEGREENMNSPRLSSLLLKSAVPPDEKRQDIRSEIDDWEWNSYLLPLEGEKNPKLMLKYHEAHLKRILQKPKPVPKNVQDRIRHLLSIPGPSSEPKP